MTFRDSLAGLETEMDENLPSVWIRGLLQHDQDLRWTAQSLVDRIREVNGCEGLLYAFSCVYCIGADDSTEDGSERSSVLLEETGASSVEVYQLGSSRDMLDREFSPVTDQFSIRSPGTETSSIVSPKDQYFEPLTPLSDLASPSADDGGDHLPKRIERLEVTANESLEKHFETLTQTFIAREPVAGLGMHSLSRSSVINTVKDAQSTVVSVEDHTIITDNPKSFYVDVYKFVLPRSSISEGPSEGETVRSVSEAISSCIPNVITALPSVTEEVNDSLTVIHIDQNATIDIADNITVELPPSQLPLQMMLSQLTARTQIA